MLGRKNYTKEEFNSGREMIMRILTVAVDQRSEPIYFNNALLALDHYFVHRFPGANYEGKDGNPLNEVRLICDSLITNHGRLRADKQITLDPEKSVLGLAVDDEIKLSKDDFKRLSTAFLDELGRRFPVA